MMVKNLNIYFLLIIITFTSALSAESPWILEFIDKGLLEVSLIGLSSLKILLVTEHFMELKFAPNWLRYMMFSWIGLVMVILAGISVFFNGF